MNCPTCPDSTLVMTDRSGVEIDYCPTCRGVWLDRGELDKIIERSNQDASPGRIQDEQLDRNRPRRDRNPSDRDEDDWEDDGRGSVGYRKKRKRESLLSELFDF